MSKYEKQYLKCGIWFIIIGPIHIFLLYNLLFTQDADIVFVHPILCLLAWLIPAMILQRLVVSLAVPDKNDRENMSATLGITSIFIFSVHAGILMVCRIIFVSIARKITRNPEFRRDEPYILWLPE